MTSGYYPDSSYRAYETDGLHPYFSVADSYANRYPSLELYAFQRSFPTSDTTTMLPVHYAAVHNSGLSAVLPIVQPANLPLLLASQDNGALAGAEALGIHPAQPHITHPSYTEKATQTVSSHATGESKGGQDELQAHQPVSRELALQERYKPTHRQTGFGSPGVVEFAVDNKEGVRLSDVLEGNWKGFEGRDDRSLFGGDRLQIIFRLHLIGCSPWKSKIPITDFTAKRQPITRMKLATGVAKCMEKFIAREKLNGHGGGYPRCDWGDVSLENVFLTRMLRVSAASWQPEIYVE